MKVTIINDHIQKFNNKRYNAGLKGQPYYRRQCRVDGKLTTKSLHREVWEYHYGEIPKGWHIHHRDHDWNNNQIENLVLIPYRLHISYHWKDPVRRKAQAERMLKHAMPKAKEWHGTEDGRKWHSEHGKAAYAKRIFIDKECAHCHKIYQTRDAKRAARFCSNNCKMNGRRRRLRGLPEDAPRDKL